MPLTNDCRMIWQRVVEFSNRGYIIRKKMSVDFCLRINISKGNYWILSFGLMVSSQKVPKFDFQSQFSTSKNHPNLSQFFLLKNINSGVHFLLLTSNHFMYLLKWCPIFDSSPLMQKSKFNNFLMQKALLCFWNHVKVWATQFKSCNTMPHGI